MLLKKYQHINYIFNPQYLQQVLRIFFSTGTGTFTMLKFECSWRLSRGEVNELFVMKARLNVVEVSSIVIKNEDRSRVKRGRLSFETRLALVCNEVWQG